MVDRMFRKVPLGMSRPAWTGTGTARPSGCEASRGGCQRFARQRIRRFERPDYLRSRYDRDATRHKPGSYQKSGDVECQSQLVWWPDYIKQSFKRAAEVGDRLFLRRAIADRAYAGAELGRGAPNTVLILLDDVGHVNDTGHDIQYGRPWSTMARPNGLLGHSRRIERQAAKEAGAL